MKKVIALVIGLIVMSYSSLTASVVSEDSHIFGFYGNSYIFVENGVEFSVFPDGQFDFIYVGNNVNGVSVSVGSPNVNISFNSGYNYDLYVQYDDYGAVIQVEDIPIYYDHYGRIIQAGSVKIRYYNSRLVQVGGLYIHYDAFGYYSHYTGYINIWNYYYVYRPWHIYYIRPFYTSCIVYDYPYRVYYTPIRYTYHYHRNHYNYRRGRSSYANGRRSFYRPGSRVHYKNGRTAVNRDYNPNRRNTAISNGRRDNTITRGNSINSRRGIAKRDTKNSLVNNKRIAKTTRGSYNKDKKYKYATTNSKRGNAKKSKRSVNTNKKSSTVFRNSGNNVKRNTYSRASSNKEMSKRSSTSTKRTVSESNSSRSKETVSRRGRG